MPFLRLLVLGIYAACFLYVVGRRRLEATRAAERAGARLESVHWCRASGFARAFVLVGAAVLLNMAGRLGPLIALVFALLTAPIAASGALRVFAITTHGLIWDGAFTAWQELTGFAADERSRRLTLWPRSGDPRTLALSRSQLAVTVAALRSRLPEIRAP